MGEGYEIYEWEKRNIYRILLAETVGKRPLGSSRLRGSSTFEMGLQGITYDDADWIYLAQTRNRWADVGNKVIKFWVP